MSGLAPSHKVGKRVTASATKVMGLSPALERLRPSLLPLFTGVRGRGVLGSSQAQATPKQHQRYALWGIRRGAPRGYSCLSAGTHPTDTARSQTMLHQELGREHRAQIHREVEHDRLEARLAKAARSDEDGVARRGRVARGAAPLTTLFRWGAISPRRPPR